MGQLNGQVLESELESKFGSKEIIDTLHMLIGDDRKIVELGKDTYVVVSNKGVYRFISHESIQEDDTVVRFIDIESLKEESNQYIVIGMLDETRLMLENTSKGKTMILNLETSERRIIPGRLRVCKDLIVDIGKRYGVTSTRIMNKEFNEIYEIKNIKHISAMHSFRDIPLYSIRGLTRDAEHGEYRTTIVLEHIEADNKIKPVARINWVDKQVDMLFLGFNRVLLKKELLDFKKIYNGDETELERFRSLCSEVYV